VARRKQSGRYWFGKGFGKRNDEKPPEMAEGGNGERKGQRALPARQRLESYPAKKKKD